MIEQLTNTKDPVTQIPIPPTGTTMVVGETAQIDARAIAEHIRDLESALRAGGSSYSLQEGPDKVTIKRLVTTDLPLLYFYCHGERPESAPKETYLGVGDGEWIAAKDFNGWVLETFQFEKKRVWDRVRPLVFINACHSAELDPDALFNYVDAFVGAGTSVPTTPVRPGITVLEDVNGNPVQYFDGKIYRSLQEGYLPSPDGTIMYYLQPPSSYDQTKFDVVGDYDLFGHPGDEWRYYLVSGFSADLTADAAFGASRPFVSSAGASPDSAYTGFSIANSQHPLGGGPKQVAGYVNVKGVLQWPNVAIKAETFADVSSYKALSVLDTFPVGDPSVLIRFLKAQYPQAPFIGNQEIIDVLARNVISYFNTVQQGLIPQ